MTDVAVSECPQGALLNDCRKNGEWTDCYVTRIDRPVTHAAFVEAFYTTWLFKIESWILGWALSKPSSDDEARELAAGRSDHFAAWSVERRAPDQLLLTDLHGRTRSWLMVSADLQHAGSTLMYFGSALVPRTGPSGGLVSPVPARPGLGFRLLMTFHDLYSRALLRAARRRLS